MSTPTPSADAQQNFFLQILQMSSSELSDRLRERGLSDDGDKATRQARLSHTVQLLVGLLYASKTHREKIVLRFVCAEYLFQKSLLKLCCCPPPVFEYPNSQACILCVLLKHNLVSAFLSSLPQRYLKLQYACLTVYISNIYYCIKDIRTAAPPPLEPLAMAKVLRFDFLSRLISTFLR